MTSPKNNAVRAVPTVKNSRTGQGQDRLRKAIVALFSGDIKGRSPEGDGVLLNLRASGSESKNWSDPAGVEV